MFGKIIVVVFILIAFLEGIIKAEDNAFSIDSLNNEIAYTGYHHKYLGLSLYIPVPDGNIDIWRRSRFSKTPGDYFRYPRGADTTTLSESEFAEVNNMLMQNIKNSYYDSTILANIKGYKYEQDHGKVKRREYYISYSRADTIYAISGWLGKFFSFYQVIPGYFGLTIDEFQNKALKLSSNYIQADKNNFISEKDKVIYFTEYIDRDSMMRIRNYQMAKVGVSEDRAHHEGKRYYNVIEITKFLDKEVMP